MKLNRPHYKDNPHLGLVTVITHSGQIEYRMNCRCIDGAYYIKNIDLVYENNEWMLINPKSAPSYIDHETGATVYNINDLTHGVVSITSDDNITLGYFTPNRLKNVEVILKDGRHYVCIDHKILDALNTYLEYYPTGVYRHIKYGGVNESHIKQLEVDNSRRVYNVIDNIDAYNESVALYNNHQFDIDADLQVAEQFISNLSFGVELETINGMLPPHLQAQYGIIICKDGSIKANNGYAPEYVTIPLKGAKGLQTLRNATKAIGLRSDFNQRCSYHLHVGGFTIDRLLMVAVYRLCYKIQNSIFKMFPVYKTNEIKYAGKEKNYCKKLPNLLPVYSSKTPFNDYINKAYTDMFMFLSGGKPERYPEKKFLRNTPNPWGYQKWNIDSRYYWVNFINPVFGKQDTIEFRLHTPTLNPDKIINWLFICNAIINYSINFTLDCINSTKLDITNVLDYYKLHFNTANSMLLSQRLKEYYNNRVVYFANDQSREDYLSLNELKTDADFKFNVLNVFNSTL